MAETDVQLDALARAEPAQLNEFAEGLIAALGDIEVLYSRTGLVMLPMRDTAQGTVFHLGEVLVSEAHIRAGTCEGYGMRRGHDLEAAMALVGWHNVHFESSRITVGRGQSLTFNGIAQGYITDKIAALLRGHGLSDVLVDMGEVMGLGNRPDGTPWKLGVAAPDGQILHRVELSDRALATSATHGTVLAGGPHILDPKGDGGQPVLVSVSAPSAALADGLSTALCLTDETQRVLSQFPKAELILRA